MIEIDGASGKKPVLATTFGNRISEPITSRPSMGSAVNCSRPSEAETSALTALRPTTVRAPVTVMVWPTGVNRRVMLLEKLLRKVSDCGSAAS